MVQYCSKWLNLVQYGSAVILAGRQLWQSGKYGKNKLVKYRSVWFKMVKYGSNWSAVGATAVGVTAV